MNDDGALHALADCMEYSLSHTESVTEQVMNNKDREIARLKNQVEILEDAIDDHNRLMIETHLIRY